MDHIKPELQEKGKISFATLLSLNRPINPLNEVWTILKNKITPSRKQINVSILLVNILIKIKKKNRNANPLKQSDPSGTSFIQQIPSFSMVNK